MPPLDRYLYTSLYFVLMRRRLESSSPESEVDSLFVVEVVVNVVVL